MDSLNSLLGDNKMRTMSLQMCTPTPVSVTELPYEKDVPARPNR